MKKCSFLAFALSCASLAWSQAATTPAPAASVSVGAQGPEAVAATDPSKVVATIDGKPITAKQALDMLKPLTPEERKSIQGKLPDVLQQLYTQHKLADEALAAKMDQQEAWKDRLVLAREQVLAQAYIAHLKEDAAKQPIDDPQKYYDSHPDEFEQITLSGIFQVFSPPGTPASSSGPTPKTEQQAQDNANAIEKKLQAGGDFKALAGSDNDNQSVASNGGKLGTFDLARVQSFPPALADAVKKLQPGQYSAPVRVNNAYMIVRVDERKRQAYADVQAQLTEKLRNEKTNSVLKQEVTEKYKIKVEDQDFFNAPGARPVPSLQRSPSGSSK